MFMGYIKEVAGIAKAATVIRPDNVYQEADKRILPYLDKMVDELILPGSGVQGMEHLEALLDRAEAGESCLLALEHYSNMDLSLFSRLVRLASPRGQALDDALVSIAGMKLSEDNPVVSAFASAYTRIIIYPSRSLASLDEERRKAELLRSNAINRAATKMLLYLRGKGRVVLVFPSGTRYRPWDPSTKRGVREIDSYFRVFDWFCPVAFNGEVLHVRPGDMMEDSVSPDLVLVTAGPVRSSSEFREERRAAAEAAGIEDKKQAVADGIMAILEDMHRSAEAERLRRLEALK
jgi:glycerol-3-phosphate O-acyltransferase